MEDDDDDNYEDFICYVPVCRNKGGGRMAIAYLLFEVGGPPYLVIFNINNANLYEIKAYMPCVWTLL